MISLYDHCQAIDILTQLLAKDPKKRPASVEDVMKHPFFTEFKLIQDEATLWSS